LSFPRRPRESKDRGRCDPRSASRPVFSVLSVSFSPSCPSLPARGCPSRALRGTRARFPREPLLRGHPGPPGRRRRARSAWSSWDSSSSPG
jgi:hypothetical protein